MRAHRSYRVAMRLQSSLSLPEHAFDQVALFVEFGIEGDRLLTMGASGNTCLDAAFGQRPAEAGAVIALVGDQHAGFGQVHQDGLGPPVVADLSCGQPQDHRLAVAVADHVQLRVQPASAPPDAARKPPF